MRKLVSSWNPYQSIVNRHIGDIVYGGMLRRERKMYGIDEKEAKNSKDTPDLSELVKFDEK